MSLRQHLLVSVDFSERSLNGIRAAAELAGQETVITLLHVLNPDLLRDSGAAELSPRERGIPLQLEKVLLGKLKQIREQELADVKKVKYELAVSRFPAEAINQHAESSRADMVILTTRGRTGLMRILMGSVAEEVIRKAPCPVLVMRPSK